MEAMDIWTGDEQELANLSRDLLQGFESVVEQCKRRQLWQMDRTAMTICCGPDSSWWAETEADGKRKERRTRGEKRIANQEVPPTKFRLQHLGKHPCNDLLGSWKLVNSPIGAPKLQFEP